MPLRRESREGRLRIVRSRKSEDLPVVERQWCSGPGHAGRSGTNPHVRMPSCVFGPSTLLCPDRQEGYP